MGKNVAVFVDVANIFYAAKAAGVDIDYVTLLKSAIAGRDFVRAYAYTGLDPDNENQRNFHSFLARHGYKVVSKDIRKYGDGKVKANLDIELVVDMLKTARNLDVAIVVSGDGDFAPAIRAVQEMGVRVEVISFRGNTSSDLIDVADLFTDIIQIAKVEKGSSRSGRRVADDGEDLSMTEVPDKLTEGTGRGRGRGTGRGRTRTGEGEPVAAASRSRSRSTTSRRTAPEAEPVAEGAPTVGLVALPGEKLSKAAQARLEAGVASAASAPAVEDEDEAAPTDGSSRNGAGDLDGEGPRRRRRRGGRGRGRGRGHEGFAEGEVPVQDLPDQAPEDLDEPEEEAPSAPRGPRPGAFGSFWDSQTGQTRTPSVESTPFDVDEEDEPAIPEYLIAEQRRGGSAGRGGRPGARGGRSGYSAAVDRERYGRGGGGGINRYPDVSGRSGGGWSVVEAGEVAASPRREDRASSGPRPDRDRPAAGRSDEPWSEVPPEVEAMLRAQLARRTDERPAPATAAAVASDAVTDEPASARGSGAKGAPRSTTRRRTPAATTTTAGAESVTAASDSPAVAKPRTTTRRKPAAEATAPTEATAEAAPKRRATTRAKATTTADDAAPKRRTTRKKADTAES